MMVLITGAAGFIGSHLAERLVAIGHEVTGVDNFDPFYSPDIKRGNLAGLEGNKRFRLIESDIADGAALERDLEASGAGAFDVVVHLAARAGVRPSLQQPVEYARTNVSGTTAVLEVARKHEAAIIFGSSSSVYGNNPKVPFSEEDPVERPISPYAATKRAGELICHTYHHLYALPVVCLRFFTVYGPRQRPDLAIHKFARLMSQGRPIPLFGDGSMQRDYTYIDDILQGIEGAVAFASSAPVFEIFNLGESRTTTTADLIRLLGEELGIEPVIDRLPEQPGDVARTFADISKARRLLGYEPTEPIERGLPKFVEWFRSTRFGHGSG